MQKIEATKVLRERHTSRLLEPVSGCGIVIVQLNLERSRTSHYSDVSIQASFPHITNKR